MNLLKPFWNDKNIPFLERTSTVYCTVPLVEFEQRNLVSNRLFENICENLPEGVILGAGFLLSVVQEDKHAKDIDFFFLSDVALQNMMKLMESPGDVWAFQDYEMVTELSETNDGSSLRYIQYKHKKGKRPDIQLIKLVYYDSPEAIIDSFDFTCVQFACDGRNVIFNPLSIMDVSKKRLVLHRMQFPSSTMRRMIKYAQKGYYVCPGALTKIAQEIQVALNKHPELLEGFVYLD